MNFESHPTKGSATETKWKELIPPTEKGRPTKSKKGRIPEWPNGADCKSAGARLRWFESIFSHKLEKPILPKAKSLFGFEIPTQIYLHEGISKSKSISPEEK